MDVAPPGIHEAPVTLAGAGDRDEPGVYEGMAAPAHGDQVLFACLAAAAPGNNVVNVQRMAATAAAATVGVAGEDLAAQCPGHVAILAFIRR